MGKKLFFKKNQEEYSSNYEEIIKLYRFFIKFKANHPDFNADLILRKLYPHIDFETIEMKSKISKTIDNI